MLLSLKLTALIALAASSFVIALPAPQLGFGGFGKGLPKIKSYTPQPGTSPLTVNYCNGANLTGSVCKPLQVQPGLCVPIPTAPSKIGFPVADKIRSMSVPAGATCTLYTDIFDCVNAQATIVGAAGITNLVPAEPIAHIQCRVVG